ncbi:MAG: glycosyltransferase [Candidatus Vogelbacteria bacterium]|nr:glycosyltransferase [Candidatus Vogelbacteria bacterium]
MRIGIFSDTFPPQVNGVANTALTSAITLGNLGHEVFVYTVAGSLLRRQGGELNGDGDYPFTIIRLPSVPAMVYHDQRIPLPLGLAINHARRVRLDIIHAHTPFSIGWEAVLAAKLFNIPIVGTHHTFYDKYLKHVKLDYAWARSFSWNYVNFYYNCCDAVVSPSKSLAQELKNYGLKRPMEIIVNAIDTELFKPAGDDIAKERLKSSLGFRKKTLVYMGRVSYEKKIDQVVRAFAMALKSEPFIGLVIVGDGPEKGAIELLVKDLGIGKNVSFVGFKRGGELVEVLQASDVFVTASDSENMPLSVLEAMSAGLPVIGARALGIPEIVKEGVNGLLFTPGDLRDMAEKIILLTRDGEMARSFSNNSRSLALNYSRGSVTRSLERFYNDIIHQRLPNN